MSQKGFAPILIVILIAAVISVGGFLVYQNSRTKPSPTSLPQQTHSTPTPKRIENMATNSADTANWKTYTNEEHGYSFKYPSDWQEARILDFLELSDYYPPAWKVFKNPNTQLDKNKRLISGSFVFVQIFDTGINLENLESQIRSAPGFISSERARISGTEAIKEVGQSQTKGAKYISITVKIDKRKGLLVSCNSIPDDALSFNLCNQILSTFKFLP